MANLGNRWKSRDVVEILLVELSAQSSEEPLAFPKLRSGGPGNVNFSKWGRKSVLLEGRASAEAQDGKELECSREAGLTQTQPSQCFPCTLDAGAPPALRPGSPPGTLFLK